MKRLLIGGLAALTNRAYRLQCDRWCTHGQRPYRKSAGYYPNSGSGVVHTENDRLHLSA